MRMERFTYAQAESALYEGMRWKGLDGKITAEREGRSRIDESMSGYNVAYCKDCLKPKGEYKSKKYAKQHRGESIAEYHNSQTTSQSRAMMTGQRASNAVGVVATLPRDNPWLKRAELTDEEFEYMRDRMIEHPHDSTANAKNRELEESIKEKLTRVRPTEEEMEQANAFLLAVKDAWLEVCGIRQEDVLFYCIHWDESYPHIHCMALPTVKKTYHEDVYSKRVKLDGTRTLLHKKGETSISYSVSRFYDEAYYGEEGKRHYPFMEKYHGRVISIIKERKELSEEIRQTADGLLNGATEAGAFVPRDFSKEQRDRSVFLAGANKRLIEDNRSKAEELAKKKREIAEKDREIAEKDSQMSQMQAEFDEKKAFLESKLNEAMAKAKAAKKEAETAAKEAEDAKEEAKAAEREVWFTKEKLTRARAQLKDAEDMLSSTGKLVDELQEKEIRLSRRVASLQTEIQEFLTDLKKVVQDIFNSMWDKFASRLKSAAANDRKAIIDGEIRESAYTAIVRRMQEIVGETVGDTEALPNEHPVREIDLSLFENTPPKRIFAIAQIKKAAQGTPYEAIFDGLTLENSQENTLIKKCLEDWFDAEKYRPILERKTEDEEVDYMQNHKRAKRAIDYLIKCVISGEVDPNNPEDRLPEEEWQRDR